MKTYSEDSDPKHFSVWNQPWKPKFHYKRFTILSLNTSATGEKSHEGPGTEPDTSLPTDQDVFGSIPGHSMRSFSSGVLFHGM